jgi:hypothetical protein
MLLMKYLLIPLFISTTIISYLLFRNPSPPSFNSLEPEQMHQQIISQRDTAIQLAKSRGDYRCCIDPPCTMCYMEANQWNNYQAGTCACDDLIAQGLEPCPQCARALNCQSDTSPNPTSCPVPSL